MATIKELAKKYKDDLESIAVISSGALATSVIDATPRDQGDLENSWTSGINEVKTRNVFVSKGDSSRNDHTIVDNLKLGDTYYFANGQPYAYRIEYEGYSWRRPQGMLGVSVAKWDSIVDNAIREAKNGK